MNNRAAGQAGTTRETLLNALSRESRSPLRLYQDLYVGSRSLVDLGRYELLTFFLGPLPGALGFTLRQRLYRRLFATAGRKLFIGPHVTLRAPGHVALGHDCFLAAHAVLDAKGQRSRIELGDSVLVGRGCILSCADASIEVGSDVSLGPYCFVRAGLSPVRLGSHVTIGAQTIIISGAPDYTRQDVPMKQTVGSAKGIVVGDDVWIGVGARIVDGVHVGDGCVIGAGAVVIEDVPGSAIVAGVPARVIGWRGGGPG